MASQLAGELENTNKVRTINLRAMRIQIHAHPNVAADHTLDRLPPLSIMRRLFLIVSGQGVVCCGCLEFGLDLVRYLLT